MATINLPHITGQVPYDVERTIQILREQLESAVGRLEEHEAYMAAQPPILTMEEIQEALGPTGSNPLETAGLLNTTPAETTPPPPPPPDDGIPDYIAIVTAAHGSLGISGTSTDEEVFRFIQTVAENINLSGMNPSGIVCGLTLAPPGGDNVFTCAGTTYRYARVTFSNGHVFKCLIDADPGGARTPTWADNGLDPSLYSVATSPSSPC